MTKPKPTTAKKPPTKAAAKPAKAKSPAAPAKPPRQRVPNTGLPFVPTDEQRNLVKLCMAIGYTQEQTARLIGPHGITTETLVKHFKEELERGGEQVLASVAANLMSIARDKSHAKCVTAAIFILKARAGWRDNDRLSVDVEGAGDVAKSGPVEFTIKIGDASPKD